MALIKLEDLTKSFINGSTKTEVIHSTNLAVEAGSFLAMTGPSGSGKTTLLTLMGALQTPTKGAVYFKDQNIGALAEKERSKLRLDEFGFILQASNLIPFLTVKEQLELVDRLQGKKRIEEQEALLKRLGIWEQRDHYISELSGGERQRTAIARALYGEPKVLFADEPTASLDRKRALEVIEMFVDLAHNEGMVIIMVTHDDRLLEYVDQVIYMVDGNLQPAE